MLKVFSHTDTEAQSLLSKVSRYTELAKMMNFPFWVFADNSNPVGVVTLGKEPIQLLAPVGTSIAVIDLVQETLSPSVLKTFASQSLQLARDKDVRIATIELSVVENSMIASFLELGFTVLGESSIMNRQLNQEFNIDESLQFTRVKENELPQWIALTKKFLSGSGDTVAKRKLENLGRLPDHFLTLYYTIEIFYFANASGQKIGILNFNPTAERISNIAVDPHKRNQGHGRQIMLFGLQQLKAAGCQKASLGVRVDNTHAVNLYKSLGFKNTERRKLLIWEDKNT